MWTVFSNGSVTDIAQVLDIGCGTGSLLETLVIPPSTVHEPPIRPSSNEEQEEEEDRELFILVSYLLRSTCHGHFAQCLGLDPR